MLHILIIDDNFEFIETLFNELNSDKSNKFKVVKICTNSKNIIDYILKEFVDVILLDLNMPNINGLQILDAIRENNIKSDVIAISGDENFILKLTQGNYHTYRMFLKPISYDKLIDTLNKMYDEKSKKTITSTSKIIELLDIFNFNKSSLGYTYIIDCLNICIRTKCKYIPNMKTLYNEIAARESIKLSSSIGWNIEKCITSMKNSTNKNILDKYFNFKPTPKAFLNCILSLYYSEKTNNIKHKV